MVWGGVFSHCCVSAVIPLTYEAHIVTLVEEGRLNAGAACGLCSVQKSMARV